MRQDYLDLVRCALPEDMSLSELGLECDAMLTDENLNIILESRLRACSRLNWQAYLENYSDIKLAAIDPVRHFVEHGIFEGRKLFSWHSLGSRLEPGCTAPTDSVSVIVAVTQSGANIRKSLQSILSQEFGNFELCVILSLLKPVSRMFSEVAAPFMNKIEIIPLPSDTPLHQARLRAVEKAGGAYIMFMDTRFVYPSNALSEAWKQILKGCDFVSIGACSPEDETEGKSPQDEHRDVRSIKIYKNKELRESQSIFDIGEPSINNKMFESGFIRSIFEQMGSEYSGGASDLFESLFSVLNARTICGLSLPLRRLPPDKAEASAFQAASLAGATAQVAIPEKLRSLILAQIPHQLPVIKLAALERQVAALDSLKDACGPLQSLVSAYGAIDVAICIPRAFFYTPGRAAELIDDYHPLWESRPSAALPPRAAILLPDGADIAGCCLASRMGTALAVSGVEILGIIYGPTDFEICAESGIKVAYMGNRAEYEPERTTNMRDLGMRLKESAINLLFYINPLGTRSFWDIALARLLNIDVIGVCAANFNQEIARRSQGMRHADLIKSFKCLAKLACPDISSEIYYRARGVDALYIPAIAFAQCNSFSGEDSAAAQEDHWREFPASIGGYAICSPLNPRLPKFYQATLRSLARHAGGSIA